MSRNDALSEQQIMTPEHPIRQKTTYVLGIGNEFRNDDGVGLVVARNIRNLQIPGVVVFELSDEGGELMAAWSGTDSVILIDAVAPGSKPGRIIQIDAAKERVPIDFFHYSTHAFSVAESIELAKVLGKLPDRCTIYGIEGSDFGMGTTVTPVVLESAEKVVEKVVRQIGAMADAPVARV